MGYGEQLPAEQDQQQVDPYNDPYGAYQYPGDMWARGQPSDQAAQVRKALFECEFPTSELDLKNVMYINKMLLDAACRIPTIGVREKDDYVRKYKYLAARMSSQGSKNVAKQMALDLLFELRAAVSVGEIPMVGLSGIGAMITTHSNQKSEVRYPQVPQASFGLLDLLPWRKRQ